MTGKLSIRIDFEGLLSSNLLVTTNNSTVDKVVNEITNWLRENE